MVEYVSAFLRGGRLTIEAILHIIVRTLVLDRYQIISNIKSLQLEPKESFKETAAFKYVVKKGEWLKDLAERFGTSVEEILKVNPGLNVKKPVWGKTICIPCQVKSE
ncbi:MAG: LysM peptidoglycan-binding domain-containing protein [Desulfotomaculum sp.]|nr:LysM peptidoglycan-binding domain-containing protein [Desulfotomaculum sp.]